MTSLMGFEASEAETNLIENRAYQPQSNGINNANWKNLPMCFLFSPTLLSIHLQLVIFPEENYLSIFLMFRRRAEV